jgi:hypothetical protein
MKLVIGKFERNYFKRSTNDSAIIVYIINHHYNNLIYIFTR